MKCYVVVIKRVMFREHKNLTDVLYIVSIFDILTIISKLIGAQIWILKSDSISLRELRACAAYSKYLTSTIKFEMRYRNEYETNSEVNIRRFEVLTLVSCNTYIFRSAPSRKRPVLLSSHQVPKPRSWAPPPGYRVGPPRPRAPNLPAAKHVNCDDLTVGKESDLTYFCVDRGSFFVSHLLLNPSQESGLTRLHIWHIPFWHSHIGADGCEEVSGLAGCSTNGVP